MNVRDLLLLFGFGLLIGVKSTTMDKAHSAEGHQYSTESGVDQGSDRAEERSGEIFKGFANQLNGLRNEVMSSIKSRVQNVISPTFDEKLMKILYASKETNVFKRLSHAVKKYGEVDNTMVYNQMRSVFGDVKLAKHIQEAIEIPSTNVLAEKYQAIQFNDWHERRLQASEVFTTLGLAGPIEWENSLYTTFVSYLSKFDIEQNPDDVLLSLLTEHHIGVEGVTSSIDAATRQKTPGTVAEIPALGMQMLKALQRRWMGTMYDIRTSLTDLFVNVEIDKILSSQLLRFWRNYMLESHPTVDANKELFKWLLLRCDNRAVFAEMLIAARAEANSLELVDIFENWLFSSWNQQGHKANREFFKTLLRKSPTKEAMLQRIESFTRYSFYPHIQHMDTQYFRNLRAGNDMDRVLALLPDKATSNLEFNNLWEAWKALMLRLLNKPSPLDHST